MTLKTMIKAALEKGGWMLRKTRGLPWGVDLCLDMRRLNVDRPAVIFDVGAHRGETALFFAARYPNSSIFSFEPTSENYRFLQQNTRVARNVKCINKAIGDREGPLAIQLFKDSQTHSLRHTLQPEQRELGRSEQVDVTTVDLAMEHEAIARLSLLKMDTEGFELQVLRGAQSALADHRIDLILLEASLDPGDRDHSSLTEVQAQLAGFSYSLAALYDQTVWHSPSPRLAYFNALFVRNSLRQAG